MINLTGICELNNNQIKIIKNNPHCVSLFCNMENITICKDNVNINNFNIKNNKCVKDFVKENKHGILFKRGVIGKYSSLSQVQEIINKDTINNFMNMKKIFIKYKSLPKIKYIHEINYPSFRSC